MIDEAKLREWKGLCNEASPGPWGVNTQHFTVAHCGNSNLDGKDYEVCMNGYAARSLAGNSDAKTDAAFIAAARTAMPALLDEITNLQCEKMADLIGQEHRLGGEIDRLRTERDALRAKLGKAREALKPFAEAALYYAGQTESNLVTYFSDSETGERKSIAIRDLIMARAAVKEIGEC